MDKSILIGLGGRPDRFRLDEDAYARLQGYLDRSAARLQDDPDRDEVMGDLERSLGDKLTARLGSEDRVVTATDVDAVLEQIGAVDTGTEPEPDEAAAPPRRRRLQRIHEGQVVAGVCTGLAAYAEIDLDWVRWGFVLATIFTAGLFIVVYVALIFILPIAPRDTTAR